MGFTTINAVYTMRRTRKYRLFEADVEKEQATPSAHRVRVQSDPVASSPLRFLSGVMSPGGAESRAHPDRTRDVWEIAVWDPLPICLRIFCLFSPGHALVYWLFLPLQPLDPRPSVTVVKCLVLQVILSGQLWFLQSRFTQQNKDTSIIQKEVMHEYDKKFVHPRLYPTVRDAATQLCMDDSGDEQDFVQTGTPNTVLRRGFQPKPNLNYVRHFDPDGGMTPSRGMKATNTGYSTPLVAARRSDAFTSSVGPRPAAMRRSTPGRPGSVVPNSSRAVATSTGQTQTQADGGYLGVYTHPNSPIKKAPSLGDLQFRSPRNNVEMAKLEQYQAYKAREQREQSGTPMRSARQGGVPTPSASQSTPNPFVRPKQSFERYPSMW